MTASWRTTVFGTGGLLFVIGGTLTALFDGKPETNPDWTAVIAALSACVGLLFARDNKVSSENAGVVTETETKP
jgi:hypothetical protein